MILPITPALAATSGSNDATIVIFSMAGAGAGASGAGATNAAKAGEKIKLILYSVALTAFLVVAGFLVGWQNIWQFTKDRLPFLVVLT
jgi:hypothetical protein